MERTNQIRSKGSASPAYRKFREKYLRWNVTNAKKGWGNVQPGAVYRGIRRRISDVRSASQARRFYALAYPFLELAPGLGYLAHLQPKGIYIATMAIMLFDHSE